MSSEMAKRVDVARFFQVESADVDRWINSMSCPVVKVPGVKKPALRMFLPDLHAWMSKRALMSERFRDYREFRRAFCEFREARRTSKPQEVASAE